MLNACKIKKRIILFIIFIMIILLTPNTSFGVSFSAKIESTDTEIRAGEEIGVKFYLQEYTEIKDGLNAYKATIEYSEDVFEKITFEDFKSKNLWEEFLYNENTHEFIAIKKSGSKESEEVLEIQLKARSDIKAGETVIKIKDVSASEGKEDIFASDAELKIQLISEQDSTVPDGDNQENTDGDNQENTDGDNQGNTDGDNQGNTDGDNQGNTDGDNQGNTDGDNQGNTDGDNQGNTDGDNQGNTDGDNQGNTDGNSQGNTIGNNQENTDGDKDVGGIIIEEERPNRLPQTGQGSFTSFILITAEVLLVTIVILKFREKGFIIKMKKWQKMTGLTFVTGVILIQFATNIYAAAMKGELNDDKNIDYIDVALLEEHLIHIKSLREDKLDVADMNSDGKLTVTDLSLLVKKIENSLEYTVEITSKLDSYYANKNQEISLKFNAEIPYGASIKAVVVNGMEYEVEKTDENSDEYILKVQAANDDGIQEFKITKVILDVGKEVKVNHIIKVDVLKDVPTIENYVIEENSFNGKITVKFNINDPDNAFISANSEIYNENEELIKSENIYIGENTLEIPVEEGKKYRLEVYVQYNLDTDSLEQNEEDHTGTIRFVKELEYIPDYKFTISNLKTYNENVEETTNFEKNEAIIIKFNSTNESEFIPTKLKINNQEYNVVEENGVYQVTIAGFSETGEKQISIEEIYLSNGKKITIEDVFTMVKIHKKSPKVEAVNFSEVIGENRLQLSFEVQDEDNTISSIKYMVTDNNNKILAEKVITGTNEVKNEITVNDLAKTYTFKVVATYNTLEEEFTDKEIYTSTINAYTKVIIKDGQVDKAQLEKNEKTTVTYTIETNKDEAIDKIIVNNIESKATKVEDKYIVEILAGETAGIQEIKVTGVIFADETEAKTDYTNQIEVLKDRASVNNYLAEDNYEENKVNFKFELQDHDESVISAKVQLVKVSDNTIWKEANIVVGENAFDLEVVQEELYEFRVLVTYSRYEAGDQIVVDDVILTKPIQMIQEYDLQISNVKTITQNEEDSIYFEKNQKIGVLFESTNSTNLYIEKVSINGKIYNVEKNENQYKTFIDEFDSSGIKEINIDRVYLNNTKELEVKENNSIQIEILKSQPTVQKFTYSNDGNYVKLTFDIVDLDNSIKNMTLYIMDEYGNVLGSEENLSVEDKEAQFNIIENEKYLIKIVASYDLDTNELTDKDNEYTKEILNEEVIVVQELIEIKDIETIKVYTSQGNDIVEVNEINVETFNPEEYIVEVISKDLPSLYAEVKETRVEDGKFIFVLDYDNVVQYDGIQRKNELEVTFGDIGQDNIARNISFEELIRRINQDPTGEFYLTQDLDANDLNVSTATILTIDFKGKINGNGYTIKNLTKPLFNNLIGAELSNITFEDANITGNGMGVIANYASGAKISDVQVSDSMITTSHQWGTGSLVGKVENGTIIEKSSAININVNGSKRVGGIVGYLNSDSKIENSYVTGTVSGSNDAIGGIAGETIGACTIQNCYSNISYKVVNNWSNGGIVGYSGGNQIVLKNNLSLADGDVGSRIIGTGYNKTSANNFEITESKLASNKDDNKIKEISKENINEEFFINQLGWDTEIWEITNSNVNNLPTLKNKTANKNISEIQENEDLYIPDIERLKSMDEYRENYEIAYYNMYKLIPFYDAKYIVNYGNQLAENSLLNTQKIQYIYAYNGEKVVTGINSESYDKLTKITIVYENNKIESYDLTFDKRINQIAVYRIDALKIKYNYNNYILEKNNPIVMQLVNLAKNKVYSEISKTTPEEESRLYVDYYNQTVIPKLEEVIISLLQSQERYNLYLDNELVKTKILNELTQDQKLEKILYTYNYYDKWYHIDINGLIVSDLLFFNGTTINKSNTMDQVVNTMYAQSEDKRMTSSTVAFYNSVLKPLNNGKTPVQFLNSFITTIGGYENPSDWFADNFKGKIKEVPLEGKETEVRYRAWEQIGIRDHLLFPILTAPQEDMYIISVPSQLLIGSLNRYYDHVSGNEELMQLAIDQYAGYVGNFYNGSAAFINNSAEVLNKKVHIQYDTRFGFASTGNQEKGTTEDPVIKWLYEAINSFAAANGSAAYANGTDVYWVGNAALVRGTYSFAIFSHETAHNQDGYYFYEGYGRRSGTDGEDHADANIAQNLGDGSFVFNIRNDSAVTSDDSNNLTVDRIAGKEEIYSYYKEMFETYYVLDYLTAQAFLRLTPEEQSKVAVQVRYQDGGDYENGGKGTVYETKTAETFAEMDLKTVEDLWDNGIALRAPGTVPGSGSYGGDNHYSIYWYQPHNNAGRADSYSFKRLGFEMLGVAGYSDGYVTFRSTKSKNDLDALRQILQDETATWKEYKMDRYEYVASKLNEIPYFDANEIIEAYTQALKKDATAGNRNNTNNLRKALYGMVKRATQDFSTGTIYSAGTETQISSAEQFVEILNNATWGNYVLTNDLDFSNIQTDEATYINKTFVGRINGNGHKITGVTKPLFSEMIYGEVQNLIIEEPIYEENTSAILALNTRHIVLNDVVVNNSNVNLPFAKANNGVVQWLGSTQINTKVNEINNIEDLLEISTNTITRKSNYKLNTDIDLSSVTSGTAIIPGTFSGVIEGNGHKIYNLKLPLFEALNGTVQNIKIENMTFNSSGTANIGALAKTTSNAKVENISISDVTINGREYMGGLVGTATNSTFNKITVDRVNLTGERFYVAGIIGRATNTTLSNARVTGSLKIKATHNGGAIGAINSGVLENVYCNVEIERIQNTDNRNQNGGLIGSIESGNPIIRNSIAIGNVANDVYKVIGGIDGKTAGQIAEKKDSISNVYENSSSTGISNTNEDNNINSTDTTKFTMKEFYKNNLGWSEEIWDFTDMTAGPRIK